MSCQAVGRIASVCPLSACSVCKCYFSDSPRIIVDCVGTPCYTLLGGFWVCFFFNTQLVDVKQFLLLQNYLGLV